MPLVAGYGLFFLDGARAAVGVAVHLGVGFEHREGAVGELAVGARGWCRRC